MLATTVVIGLGQFGSRLATALVSRKVQVMAIDRRADRVSKVAQVVDRAICFDATDEAAMLEAAVDRTGVAVCALGEDAIQASIMVTALLSQMGVPRIIARSITELQSRILLRVGAHEVINPEQDMGERLAQRLASPGLIDEIPLADNVSIAEVKAPESFVGRTLMDLHVRKNFGLNVVAIRREREGASYVQSNPQANDRIERGDLLFVMGNESDIRRLTDSAKVLR